MNYWIRPSGTYISGNQVDFHADYCLQYLKEDWETDRNFQLWSARTGKGVIEYFEEVLKWVRYCATGILPDRHLTARQEYTIIELDNKVKEMNTEEKKAAYFRKIAAIKREINDLETLLYFLSRPCGWHENPPVPFPEERSVAEMAKVYTGVGTEIERLMKELREEFADIKIDF
ncbi:MAG: hypothetical protein LBE04_03555 [Prevotellaceae bacterium]|jgi:hypothetical protein|nr:hypothetical protein [Prevotellaceae bacterium]